MTSTQADKRIATAIVKGVADTLARKAKDDALREMAALGDDDFEAWLNLWYGPPTDTPESEVT